MTILADEEDYPIVPEDMEVSVFAQEPLVRNPCAIAFGANGRLYVGMGPQYRKPTPNTKGDSVYILIDSDDDGVADDRKEFARGLNNIQGMAWRGDQLWIANSPDLTVVRDFDGDDEADDYLRIYTDLGNIEHGLHGLNWAPDGKLYMSKGNSKGLNQTPDRIAPKAFRELWGMDAPEGIPDFPEPKRFSKDTYQNTFHDPDDDWGLNGGILRCNPDGTGLEIVSRGMRNPWDITFDSQFNWIGTDNDQNLGDKIFSPFYSANFGWGHPWSYDWLGDDHLPSAPSAGPLFEGSGTGVIYCDIDGYPDHYRGVFLINDWIKRDIYIYRPQWKGAWMRPLNESLSSLASAGTGRTMAASAGRRFDPVDIEIGPDKAIYVSSWGRQYGSVMREGRMVNEGRIYRLWPKSLSGFAKASNAGAKDHPSKGLQDLIRNLGSHLPVWRTDSQNALVEMGEESIPALKKALAQSVEGSSLETWVLWTLGRIGVKERSLDSFFETQWQGHLNRRLQSFRIAAFQARERKEQKYPAYAVSALRDENARLRHESVLGLHQTGDTRWNRELLRLIQSEEDRLVFYSAWQAMRDLFTESEKKLLLKHEEPPLRRAALLCLLEDDLLSDPEIQVMTRDSDTMTAFLAQKRLGGKAQPVIKGPAIKGLSNRSAKNANQIRSMTGSNEFTSRVVKWIKSESGRQYEEATLVKGVRAYTDRSYQFLKIPDELAGQSFIRSANDDADYHSGGGMQFELMFPSKVFIANDLRGEKVPEWLTRDFNATDLYLQTNDARHRLFAADFPVGLVNLGSNKDGVRSPKAGYIVIIQPQLMQARQETTDLAQVLDLLPKGDIFRGQTLFHHPNGARCHACHRLEGQGNAFAPDLSDIGKRASAEMIAESILNPSAEITEGFASQTIETKQGETYEGLIVSESGRELTLANALGQTVKLLKTQIESRKSSKLSSMPGGLGDVLSPSQIADLIAYLQNLPSGKKEGVNRNPLNPKQEIQVTATKDEDSSEEESVLKASPRLLFLEDGIEVFLGNQTVMRYYHKHPEVHRPFWAQVKTPSGQQVTRQYPPIAGVDAMDHPHMHPGLSIGYAVLNGVNFWHNREGKVIHQDYLNVDVHGSHASFSTRQSYIDSKGLEICEELSHYKIVPNTDGYLLSWEFEYTSENTIYFEVKEEMGLTMRVATPLVVKSGSGRILASHGGVNESGTWGKKAQWWDYSGTINKNFLGIQVMSGPGNPDVWSHSRDYGVLVANPFPVDVKANRGHKTFLRPEETLRLKFGIQIHEHKQSDDFKPEKIYQRFLELNGDRD